MNSDMTITNLRALPVLRGDTVWGVTTGAFGEDVVFRARIDVWLTFEGSGQWAGYQWLVHPSGGNIDAELARRAAMRSRWWSQNEGLAIALTLDRIGPENWSDVAFGDGSQTLLEMLDVALGAP